MNTCEFLKDKPSFMYRDITHNVINKLYEMWEGGFCDVASVNQTVYLDGIKGSGKSKFFFFFFFFSFFFSFFFFSLSFSLFFFFLFSFSRFFI